MNKCCAHECPTESVVDINSENEFPKHKELPLCEKHFRAWLLIDSDDPDFALNQILALGDKAPLVKLNLEKEAILDMFVNRIIKSEQDPIN